ncbi:nitrate ABC transporter substrate-binding protein [Herbaspirillum rubrisubalbicans]|uniref:Nitrate ABC transporter substrate-binding protein n=1 Tax=Herbaspirillum rubrisubalbicans TaxID=80842 RepID=A0ABX9C7G2_9BURK|nr:ABC transporter substrate-binding protein [Herbaspirillum rubrisubalbicans]RAM66880.1 nitrate ABC transporter substrate-binding protein [Herbaspirillum rubrisubalbicans]RAN47540.1 nitrate ABC transporter substrate-binding protein [Herbaspirillum rubrisubalbicans]
MKRRSFTSLMIASALALSGASGAARAEAQEVRISHGYGLLYLPLMVMRDQGLVEKHAKAMGLGDVKTKWVLLDGGNVINDAMLAGNLDIAGTGAPGFVTLWSKAHGIPRSEVVGLGALSTSPLWLNTNNPNVKSLKDFTAKDKIAIPGIKTSLSAVLLQMAAAKTFGIENYAKLDPLTVSLSHPEAMASLISGKTEITAHFTSPPFSYQEAKAPGITRVLNSTDVLGHITIDVVFALKSFTDKNPKLTQAVMAAQEEANAYIAKNRKGAAEIFLRVSKLKLPQEEVEQMLADPGTEFSTTPVDIMQYLVFMSKAGTIKTKPAVWNEMFVPAFKERKGS